MTLRDELRQQPTRTGPPCFSGGTRCGVPARAGGGAETRRHAAARVMGRAVAVGGKRLNARRRVPSLRPGAALFCPYWDGPPMPAVQTSQPLALMRGGAIGLRDPFPAAASAARLRRNAGGNVSHDAGNATAFSSVRPLLRADTLTVGLHRNRWTRTDEITRNFFYWRPRRRRGRPTSACPSRISYGNNADSCCGCGVSALFRSRPTLA